MAERPEFIKHFEAERSISFFRFKRFCDWVDGQGGFGNAEVDAAFAELRGAMFDLNETMDVMVSVSAAAVRRVEAYEAFPTAAAMDEVKAAASKRFKADAEVERATKRFEAALAGWEAALNAAASADAPPATRAERRRRKRSPAPRTDALFKAMRFAQDQKGFMEFMESKAAAEMRQPGDRSAASD